MKARSRALMRRASGRGATPGLVRVCLPSTAASCAPRTACRAQARTPSGVRCRLFVDADHGGPAGAEAAARHWRAAELAAANVPDPPCRRVVLKPRSGSGIVGVYRRVRRHGSPVWEASYGSSTGERQVRSFSEGKYGPITARALALEQRQAWERADLGSTLPMHEDSMSSIGARGSAPPPARVGHQRDEL